MKKIVLKKFKKVRLFVPNDIRLSFYIYPLNEDISEEELSKIDFSNITLLDKQTSINSLLYDETPTKIEGSNIYSLLEEGVLKGQLTGADLGIYDYKSIEEYVEVKSKFDDKVKCTSIKDMFFYDKEDDFNFTHCVLAEENPLGGKDTQVVLTFKGYLEVTKTEFSILRRCNNDSEFSYVFVPQIFVNKYKLRNGDEILGACKEVDGKIVLNSIFSINQQSRYKWEVEREWFNNLTFSKTSKQVKASGELSKTISNKFKLFVSDNVFLYFNKTSQTKPFVSKFIEELNTMFDRVIYINPQYQPIEELNDMYSIAKFCAQPNDLEEERAIITLLGVNYAKRLIELGKRVAVVIDNIDAIMALDKNNMQEMPICTTLLNCIRATTIGSCAGFIIVPLRVNTIKTIQLDTMFKAKETLGIVIENNEIDLFKSYRI